ncbi:hypothetical protein SKAU_G00416970 [Synaphobranchus kaupii]|uniref:Ig-like domain-containing protein n=1 Tax=Synaphobranchus kaupii TaxID=118154 RepID=A0A9Q1E5X0_SYNKA|nr:hypothetical protein SKAU_G00416970 [Synaphobranchus kaupii]
MGNSVSNSQGVSFQRKEDRIKLDDSLSKPKGARRIATSRKVCVTAGTHLSRASPVRYVLQPVTPGDNWGIYSPASPSLSVSGELKAGKAVIASCSVSHSCPSGLPHLTWNHTGTLIVQSEQLTNGQWRVTSNLTFTAANSDNNKRLTCTAEYQHNTSEQRSKILNVKYAPASVEVETESTVVREGDTVELRCSSDSNPPAHSYQWYNITGTLLSEEKTYKLHNVSRRNTAFYCAAINTEGHKNSTPVKISVEYAPASVEVETESTVVREGDTVELRCSSDSNPPAHSYQWYNITGTLLSEEKTYKLHNVSRRITAFYCAATNTEGHKNSTPVKISVEYAPEIKEGLACTTKTTGVACLCIVDSEPPPEIEWLLPVGTHASSSTERHGSITLGILRSTQRLTETVTCQASNSRGNTATTFSPSQTDKPLYCVIAVASVLLVAALAVMVWLTRRNG